MILHPGSIVLITISGISLLLLSYASILGIKILNRWDINSNSEEQFMLERHTYLVSTIVQYLLSLEIVSLFIFIYVAEDIHGLLVGAMCATGSLNANRYGFPLLFVKILLFFLSASWVAINYLDNKAEDYPLIKQKYRLIIILSIAFLAEFMLQFSYFKNIQPDVITSCCGVIFSEGKGIKSSIDRLHLSPVIFFSFLPVITIIGLIAHKTLGRLLIYTFSASSVLSFIISILSIVSFVSAYFYQIPTHNCPFCILKRQYNYAGYPLYISLFAGTLFGILTGISEPLKGFKSLSEIVTRTQKKWILYSILCFTIFYILSALSIILSPLKIIR